MRQNEDSDKAEFTERKNPSLGFFSMNLGEKDSKAPGTLQLYSLLFSRGPCKTNQTDRTEEEEMRRTVWTYYKFYSVCCNNAGLIFGPLAYFLYNF